MSKTYLMIALDVPDHLDALGWTKDFPNFLRQALLARGLDNVAVGGSLGLSPDDIERLAYYSGRSVARSDADWQKIVTKMGELSLAVDRAVAARKKEAAALKKESETP